MTTSDLRIRPFSPADQPATRQLILDGLAGHFGWLDETANPDLDDIQSSYLDRGARFVVAEIAGELVGTGALIAEAPGVGRLVRMSVSGQHRRRGIGRALVEHFILIAQAAGYTRLIIETNDDWDDAIGLYRRCGFVEERRAAGETHMALDLRDPPATVPGTDDQKPRRRSGEIRIATE